MNEWENRYKHLETAIGAGYYALRQNDNKPNCWKLVKADRSPSTKIKAYSTPSVGQRTDRPARRRARREK